MKSLEGVHLSSSGHLLNLLIEKYFALPYLSLVRYADHIACQRVEMIQSLPLHELSNQFTDQHLKQLDKFFTPQFKYSYRHQRLIQLLEQLKKSIDDYNMCGDGGNQSEAHNSLLTKASSVSIDESPSTPTMPPLFSAMKTSPSVDFFMLYLNSSSTSAFATTSYLDKEWYYNIVNSACSSDVVLDTTSLCLKPKQCALMLSSLDLANIISVMSNRRFRLNILRECILLGAHRTQLDILKLPSVLKQAAMMQNDDFMHPLWLASTNSLFNLLKEIYPKLPEPSSLPINLNE